MSSLNDLPAPPKGQVGVSLDQFQHLPPPPKGQTGVSPSAVPGATQQNTLLDNPITRGIQSIFPGQKVGQAIGTLGGLAAVKISDALHGTNNAQHFDTSAPSPLQVAGDIGQGALTIAAPELGTEGSALAKIGTNAAVGAGLGLTGSVANADTAGQTLKNTAIGGALGGATSAAAEGLKTLTESLPKWLTKAALPKLDTKNIPYALENTKVGSLATIQKQSNASLNSYEGSIQSILSHPEFKAVAADSNGIINQAVSKFPDSNYTSNDLVENAKSLAPKVGKLLQKFEAGQADIQEVNTIRKELDQATKSVYTSINRPPEAKLLGATLANAMRDYVQTNAPETQPIFQNYAKEIGLNKAIGAAVKKGEQKVRLGDIAAGTAGFAKGGLSGALEGIIAERLLLNPSAQLAGAKLLTGASKIAAPVGKAAIQGLKAPLIRSVTK